MGKMLENPRYNILSIRLSDWEMSEIDKLCQAVGATRSQYIRAMLQAAVWGQP